MDNRNNIYCQTSPGEVLSEGYHVVFCVKDGAVIKEKALEMTTGDSMNSYGFVQGD